LGPQADHRERPSSLLRSERPTSSVVCRKRCKLFVFTGAAALATFAITAGSEPAKPPCRIARPVGEYNAWPEALFAAIHNRDGRRGQSPHISTGQVATCKGPGRVVVAARFP